MSTFAVKVTRIKSIEPIENADAIELAVIGDYRSVVKKGEYALGQLAVYIPEASIIPQPLLKEMGLEGKLRGAEKNRVKAIKLRGCLSQGLIYPVYLDGISNDWYINGVEEGDRLFVQEGDCVKDFLGITKWEPPVPVHMAGEVYNAGQHLTVAYDIENFKAYPDVLKDGEMVVMTEKLHGTFCGVGILPKQDWDEKHYRGKFVVFSKGLGAQGLCFKDNEKNKTNVYIRTLEKLGIFDKLEKINPEVPFFVFGEVFGKNVQDLEYGLTEPSFNAFDICVGYRGQQRYYYPEEFFDMCLMLGIATVPFIYTGEFSKEKMYELTSGYETLSGKKANIREGLVIRPMEERYVPDLGRVILKSISETYLLRKHGTEYN